MANHKQKSNSPKNNKTDPTDLTDLFTIAQNKAPQPNDVLEEAIDNYTHYIRGAAANSEACKIKSKYFSGDVFKNLTNDSLRRFNQECAQIVINQQNKKQIRN